MRAQSRCESWREDFFFARECKEPSARSFKPVLVGASPTTGAISPQRSRSPTGRGTASRTPPVLVRIAAPAATQVALRVYWMVLPREAFSRDYPFEPEALRAKQPAFNRLRRVQFPTGSPTFPAARRGFLRNMQVRLQPPSPHGGDETHAGFLREPLFSI